MSFYSYDVSVNTSTPSTDVGLPDRGVKSATTSLNPDTPSSDVRVYANANWINAPTYQDVDLPTGNEVYLFDMNNPSCWPGTGATIFDLSGNGYNCEHAQLNLQYDDPAADTATNAPCSWVGQSGFSFTDDSTVLDYIDTGYNSELGTYLHINPDIENENVKYIRYPAPGTVYENYTFFMVAETYGVDDYEQSETLIPGEPVVDEDPDGDFTILGKTRGAQVSIRGGSGGSGNRGFSFRAPRTSSAFSYDFNSFYGLNAKIYGRQYMVTHGTYGQNASGRIVTPMTYFIDDDSLYSDVFSLFPEDFWTPDFESKAQADLIDNYTPGSQNQYARFDHTGIQVFSVTGEGNKSRTYLNGKYIGEMDLNRYMVDSNALYWTVGIGQNGNNTVRACSASQVKIYAWGLYDRTFTTEEHLQIHRKYLRHPNPTKEVEVRGIPNYSLFNIANDVGRPDTDIEIAFNAGAISSYDISLDLSSSSADVSVTPLPVTAPRLDLDAKYWVDGATTWQDASISKADFEAVGSPTKTADGFIRLNGSNYFTRLVVTAPDPLTTNIEDYVRDPFIPYDSSFTFEFVFRLDPTKDFLVPAESAGQNDNYKFFGYSSYFTENGGGGFNYGTSTGVITLEDGSRIAKGLQVNAYAGNNKDRGVPPYSARQNFDFFVTTGDANFDLGVSDAGVPDGTVYYVQLVYDVENSRVTHYVNGVLIGENNVTLGIGLAGKNQTFFIGRKMQGGWVSAPGIDVKTLKIYDYAMSSNDISRRYTELQE